eukprot:gene30139-40030_t
MQAVSLQSMRMVEELSMQLDSTRAQYDKLLTSTGSELNVTVADTEAMLKSANEREIIRVKDSQAAKNRLTLQTVRDEMTSSEEIRKKELGLWKDSCDRASAAATNFQREKDMYKMRYEQLLKLYVRLGYQMPNESSDPGNIAV